MHLPQNLNESVKSNTSQQKNHLMWGIKMTIKEALNIIEEEIALNSNNPELFAKLREKLNAQFPLKNTSAQIINIKSKDKTNK
jgi:hypothetical protein